MFIKKFAIVFLSSIIIFACSNSDAQKADDTPPTQIETINNPTETPTKLTGEATRITSNFIAAKSNDGITTAITWVYLDEYRLAFESRISGMSAPAGYQLPCPIRTVSIIDNQGYLYKNYENGHGESENLSPFCSYQSDTNSFVVTYNFYHDRPGLQQANVSLIISLGNFELFTENGQQILLPDFGTYTFNLSIPAKDTLTVDSNETIELSGVKATLNRIEINPTFTVARLCLQYEDYHGWYPDISLLVDDKSILANPELTLWTNYNPNADWYDSFTSFRCYKFTFPVELIANSMLQTKNMEVSLNNLEINFTDATTQDECSKLRNEIQITNPDLDFTCHIDYRGDGYGFSLEITKTPFGMSMESANKLIEESFKKNISGPWLFSIELLE